MIDLHVCLGGFATFIVKLQNNLCSLSLCIIDMDKYLCSSTFEELCESFFLCQKAVHYLLLGMGWVVSCLTKGVVLFRHHILSVTVQDWHTDELWFGAHFWPVRNASRSLKQIHLDFWTNWRFVSYWNFPRCCFHYIGVLNFSVWAF